MTTIVGLQPHREPAGWRNVHAHEPHSQHDGRRTSRDIGDASLDLRPRIGRCDVGCRRSGRRSHGRPLARQPLNQSPSREIG
jgi:hypothetical protein